MLVRNAHRPWSSRTWNRGQGQTRNKRKNTLLPWHHPVIRFTPNSPPSWFTTHTPTMLSYEPTWNINCPSKLRLHQLKHQWKWRDYHCLTSITGHWKADLPTSRSVYCRLVSCYSVVYGRSAGSVQQWCARTPTSNLLTILQNPSPMLKLFIWTF